MPSKLNMGKLVGESEALPKWRQPTSNKDARRFLAEHSHSVAFMRPVNILDLRPRKKERLNINGWL